MSQGCLMVVNILKLCYVKYMVKPPWNKGLTKETHLSVQKISRTMRRKKIDNFKSWREKMVLDGKIKVQFDPFKKSDELAELFGVVLGDGNISVFPRCERLIISANGNNKYFIERYSSLVKKIFDKNPSVTQAGPNCIRISIYENKISSRLSIPVGNRKDLDITIPAWIKKRKQYIVACLKGLFEAEGSLSIHLPTYTYNFQFSNYNTSILNFVENSLLDLGFHPERREIAVRLRRKSEVRHFEKMISFKGK